MLRKRSGKAVERGGHAYIFVVVSGGVVCTWLHVGKVSQELNFGHFQPSFSLYFWEELMRRGFSHLIKNVTIILRPAEELKLLEPGEEPVSWQQAYR